MEIVPFRNASKDPRMLLVLCMHERIGIDVVSQGKWSSEDELRLNKYRVDALMPQQR